MEPLCSLVAALGVKKCSIYYFNMDKKWPTWTVLFSVWKSCSPFQICHSLIYACPGLLVPNIPEFCGASKLPPVPNGREHSWHEWDLGMSPVRFPLIQMSPVRFHTNVRIPLIEMSPVWKSHTHSLRKHFPHTHTHHRTKKGFLRYQLTQLPFGENTEINLFSIMNGPVGRTANLKDVVSFVSKFLWMF